MAGILKDRQSLAIQAEAPEHERRVERNRGKGVARNAVWFSVACHRRDDGDAGRISAERVAKVPWIDHRTPARQLVGWIRHGWMFARVVHPLVLKASDFRTAAPVRPARNWCRSHRSRRRCAN